MKTVFVFLFPCFFFLNAFTQISDKEPQKTKDSLKTNLGSKGDRILSNEDTISNYSIKISGGLNSVQITSDQPFTVSQDTLTKGKNNSNSVELKGESNYVNISQSGKGGKVEIRQNGKNNQVKISQSKQESEK